MLKRIVIFLFFINVFAPSVRGAEEGGVVINSFQIAGKTANDEFVELKNTGSLEVDLFGYQLKKISFGGTEGNLVTSFPKVILAPGQALIVGHADYSGVADMPYTSRSYYMSSDSAIVLYGPEQADDTRVRMDLVGYGKSKNYERAPVIAPKNFEIYARRNGRDTDNNLNDFYLSYAPAPEKETPPADSGAEKEQPIAAATSNAKIRVNEFMPNPEGSDTEGEWIEIYNDGNEANITGYAVLDKMGSPKKYKFPAGTIIKRGQYLAFYSFKTPISLNNDNEAVELQDQNGRIISSSAPSGKGPEGASFAFDGSGWSWTTKPTPGGANVIERPKETGDGNGQAVLALVDEKNLPVAPEGNISQTQKNNDRLLGYALIILAISGAISYTLYINKERLREFYYKIRKRDGLAGSKIWQKIKGR